MDHFLPASWFSPSPGATGTIHSRPAIRDWYLELEATTERLRVTTIGASTESNPIDALFITNSLSDAEFERLAQSRADELQSLLNTGEPGNTPQPGLPIVLITSGIHATEIGGPQSIPELVHWLVASDDAIPAMIRDRLVTIIVPTLNPDGMDLVHRWNTNTLDTPQEGTMPPLLYHRFAGHDNNRDWIFRNLVETRTLLDTIHRQWIPHITLDQHQMGKFGPRFVLPPYCDPWDPWVPAAVIAGSNMLGQSIATDITLQGFRGVQTHRYFDAWEPSRAIQHYRGGLRILAEAASANLAHPIEISDEQLRQSPMPMSPDSTGGQPRPWPGGAWTLRDIVEYQLAAARSLLIHVARDPELWNDVQRQALSATDLSTPSTLYHIDPDLAVGDPGAQHRLATMMAAASTPPSGSVRNGDPEHVDSTLPLSRLPQAVLPPTQYPVEYGPLAYDLTSHHVPMMMGALVQASTESAHGVSAPVRAKCSVEDGGYLTIDGRSHQAPMVIERALRDNRSVWRTTRSQMTGGNLVHAGSWIVDCSDAEFHESAAIVASHRISALPNLSDPVDRRDIVLVSTSDQSSADYGWSRLWLHQQGIPFLETRAVHLAHLMPRPAGTALLLPESGEDSVSDELLSKLGAWVGDGGRIITFGKTARSIVPALAPDVAVIDGDSHPDIKAPGALVKLQPDHSHPASRGLDRSIPAMFARDGAFHTGESGNVAVIARFAQRDTVVSGWMAGAEHIAGQTAVLQINRGSGTLVAFSFRPLFRAQMLVTSPLFHNLLYQADPENVPAS